MNLIVNVVEVFVVIRIQQRQGFAFHCGRQRCLVLLLLILGEQRRGEQATGLVEFRLHLIDRLPQVLGALFNVQEARRAVGTDPARQRSFGVHLSVQITVEKVTEAHRASRRLHRIGMVFPSGKLRPLSRLKEMRVLLAADR